MRVALVNTAMDMGKLGGFSALLEPMPVIGMAYLVAVTEQAGHRVRAYDQFASQTPTDQLVRQIIRWNPDVLGMGVLTPSADVASVIADSVKSALPDCKLVAGNIHADVLYQDTLERTAFDFVVHGEGEETFIELLDALGRGGVGHDLKDIAGISYRDEAGEVQRTASRPVIADLDALPYPAWHHFPVHTYGLLPLADVAKPTLVMAGSRGCPYRCEFCSLLHAGANYRKRDPEALAEEYEHLHHCYGAKQIGFVDPIFPLDKNVLMNFCDHLMRRGMQDKVAWISETRVDRVDRESLRVMRKSGCRRLLFGIESGVDLLLENVNKTFTTERVRRTVALCREEDIQTVGLFMIGLPGETEEMSRQTIDFACSLDLDFAKFAITIPFPGSQMFEDLRREGRLDRDDWENWTTFQPEPDLLPFVPRDVSNEKLIELQKWGTRKFYFRPRQIARQLVAIRSMTPTQIWNGVKGVMG
jgi:anaerobic magnesium-protoporphyrin IX monomethyl ester cyclase